MCTDPDLVKFGVTAKVTNSDISYSTFSDVKANSTIDNVLSGVDAFKASGADFIVAVGEGFGD